MADQAAKATVGRTAWGSLAAIVAAYLAVSVAEAALAPLFPSIEGDLKLGTSGAGVVLGVLTAHIAMGNLLGGYLLHRVSARTVAAASLGVAAAGCALAARSTTFPMLVASQALIGLGAGLFFAPGLKAAGLAGGPNRRGLAMGIFGVAFSAGLAVAAYLAAAMAGRDWNGAFAVAGGACAAGLLIVYLVRWPQAPEPPARTGRLRAMRLPVLVGTVGTVSQYGTVGFLALFAVSSWDFTAAAAALLLGAGRVLSVAGKLIVGSAADRFGSLRAVRGVGIVLVATGASWSLLPRSPFTIGAAVLFTATVSALFPIANLVAFERFGDQGAMLGAYRSVQIGIGAAAAFSIGILSDSFGLRPVLTISALVPFVLLGLSGRRQPVPEVT